MPREHVTNWGLPCCMRWRQRAHWYVTAAGRPLLWRTKGEKWPAHQQQTPYEHRWAQWGLSVRRQAREACRKHLSHATSSYITLLEDNMHAEGPHHIPVGLSLVCPQVLNIGCKAFIQPQVVPPPQGNQITKPLTGQTREEVRMLSQKNCRVIQQQKVPSN